MSWLQSDQFGNFWANFWQSPPREKPERDNTKKEHEINIKKESEINTKKEPEIGNFTQILCKKNSVILDAGKENWRQWHISTSMINYYVLLSI